MKKYSLNEIFIKVKFAFSIYLWLLEQGLRNTVDYQDEGLLTWVTCGCDHKQVIKEMERVILELTFI